MLVPAAVVCQYHVSPIGAEPVKFIVTPGVAHCGEFDVGLAGSEGVVIGPGTGLTMAIGFGAPGGRKAGSGPPAQSGFGKLPGGFVLLNVPPFGSISTRVALPSGCTVM